MADMSKELLFILKMRDEASAAMRSANRAVDAMGREARQTSAQLAAMNVQSKAVGATMHQLRGLIAGGAIFYALKEAIQASTTAAVEFDRTLVKIEALVGINSNTVRGWTGDLKNMAIELGRPVEELAGGLYFITSSGIEASESMEVLEASAQAAAAGLADTETVADVATTAMNAWRTSNLSAADAIGQMIEGIKLGKIEAEEMTRTIGQAVPNAAAAGVEFWEVNAALAAMSLSGLDAARGATVIRQTMQDVLAPSEQARKHLDSLNVSVQDMQEVFREEGYLQGLEYMVDLLGEEHFRKVINDAEAFTGMMTLLGENAEQAKMIFEEMADSGADTLREAFEIASQSDSFAFDQGVELLNRALLELGEEILPLVISAIHEGIEALAWLQENGDEVKAVFVGLAYAAGTVATGALIQFVLQATIVQRAAIAMVFQLGGVRAAFMLVATQAIPAVIAAIRSLLVAMGPIGLAAAGIGALTGALYYLETGTEDAVVATQSQVAVQEELDQLLQMTEASTMALAGATEEGRKAAIAAAEANYEQAESALAIAAAEAIAAQAIAFRASQKAAAAASEARENSVKAGGYSSVGLNSGDARLTAEAAQLATEAAELEREAAAAGIAYSTAMTKVGDLADLIEKAKNPPEISSNRSSPAGPGKTGGKSALSEAAKEAERLREQYDELIDRLNFEAQTVGFSQDQYAFLSDARRLEIELLGTQYERIEDVAALTDEQVAGSEDLARAREIANGHLRLSAALREDEIEQLELEIGEYTQLLDTLQLTSRQRFIEQSVIKAHTEALKDKVKWTEEEEEAARRRAAAEFDYNTSQDLTSNFQNMEDRLQMIAAEGEARRMNARDAAQYLAVREEEIQAMRDGITLAPSYLAMVAQVAAAEYDAANAGRDMVTGWNDALDELQENALSSGDIVYEGIMGMANLMSSALGNMVTGQKVALGEMVSDFAAGISQMIAQMLVWAAFVQLMRAIGVPIPNAQGGMFGIAGGEGTNLPAFAGERAAKGAWFSDQVAAFAAGGAFTNSVVSRPTNFMFNNGGSPGLGLMGEAGPEAIMPLEQLGAQMAVTAMMQDGSEALLPIGRTNSGKLGVMMASMFAKGGVFSDRDTARALTGYRTGGTGDYPLGQYDSEGGNTYVEAPITVQYQSSGDAELDKRNIKALEKTLVSVVDDRIGKAMKRVGKSGGANNMFGMNKG